MNKTESKILKILNENNELVSYKIDEKLEEIGYSVTPDTIAKNLKRMAEEEKIIRTARGKPWYYHYKLNKNCEEK